MMKPPAATMLVMEAFCLVLSEPATKISDPHNSKSNFINFYLKFF